MDTSAHRVESSRDGNVGEITFSSPPANHLDTDLVEAVADHMEEMDGDSRVRALVLRSEGRHFCAGARLSPGEPPGRTGGRHVYDQADRLFGVQTPIIAAVQGAAVGGGLGLALAADVRVGDPTTRMQANFTQLGLHPGFGLTVTLPRVVGAQWADRLLVGSERLDGEAARRIGLLDELVAEGELLEAARSIAARYAALAPVAVVATRATLRRGLHEQIHAAMDVERSIQDELACTADFAEGLAAATERRAALFRGV